MIDLLQNYTIQQVFMFIIFLGLAVKGVVTFYDWAVAKMRDLVHEGEKPDQLKKQIQNHEHEIDEIKQLVKAMSQKIDILINSDKDAIKAYITKQHHYFCYDQKWIDDHSLDCIERRYTHYKDEGGNSFICTLMKEIRDLPKQPMEVEQNDETQVKKVS